MRDYLIPSMTEQGIKEGNIEVWLDSQGDGCLFSCMKCFAEVGKRGSGRWHMQDDALISSNFREMTEKYDFGVVTTFVRDEWQNLTIHAGRVPAAYLWNSFICIRIPDDIAGECAEWFYNFGQYEYPDWAKKNKGDDTLFFKFFTSCHAHDYVFNLAPNIVDHIDFLIGGSIVNKWRGHYARADLWEDEEAFEKMKDKLARR